MPAHPAPRVAPHVAPRRLAVLQSGHVQGSGYLLTPTLVLTAAHVVAGDAPVRLTTPGGPIRAEGRRVGTWYDPGRGIDVALVAGEQRLADDDAFPDAPPGHAVPAECWADTASLDPVAGCEAIGFPHVQRFDGGRLDTEQVIGTYKPGSNLFSEYGVLVVDGAPPTTAADGTSPWAGLSGAAVLTGGALLGVVVAQQNGWQQSRIAFTPLARLLGDETFVDALTAHGYRVPRLVSPPRRPPDFETRYADHLARHHGTLRIFGIDFTARSRVTWPLDSAYYGLEVTADRGTGADGWAPGRSATDIAGGATGGAAVRTGPLPAERALAGQDRVLLRGVAGSGKSTLVQWLAVGTARQDLGEHLRHLHGLVPYVLPLRTIARQERLPMPAEFLTSVGTPLTAPPGWTEQVLTDRRALVLVDGLDEVDERTRTRVGEWLRLLLDTYPGNRWLVTSRPSAVEDSWLADMGFTELTLAPMSRADIRAFTARWHDAARATVPGDPEELARLDAYERSLHDALHTKQDLARLATNPLMCSLICALHRDRNGYLPTGRKELYDAALSMLLNRRDRERDLEPQLTEAPQIQLLQRLAYWLVKNGQAEMDRADAVELVAASLPAMPAVEAALGSAPDVYRHLLDRSGLIREPVAGTTVDFVHRTFQDYLAAKAAIEERDFDLMVRNAHHDQWADVIRMAVAHARPDERARLLKKLLTRGDRTKTHRSRLHLLALACLEHATELDPAVRSEVEKRGAALIPPRSFGEAKKLAEVGPMVLELLPGPEGLDDDQAEAVAETAWLIGGDAAVPVLARFTDHPVDSVRERLAQFPLGVDRLHYAAKVMDRLPRADTQYLVGSIDDLRAVLTLGGIEILYAFATLGGGFDDLLSARGLIALQWADPVTDEMLARLSDLPKLDDLGIECGDLTDLSALADLPLTELRLNGLPNDLDLSLLAGLPRLTSLAISSDDPTWPGTVALPDGLPLTHLYTGYGTRGLEGIERLTGLVHFGCHSPLPDRFARADWDRLASLPELTSLSLSNGITALLEEDFPPLPNIRVLSVTAVRDGLPVDVLRHFPGVEELSIRPLERYGSASRPPIDLAPFAALPRLGRITLHGIDPAAILNADALPAHVTVTL
ncbi:NACHT domain-containing protein [Streptomyces sp. NPDC088194]|uniref:NACHT domain-containing protein n=1 Tax=Streptomyces sp. NPDC088194 TaxID=3154931 RepID=UPI00344D8B8E